MNQCNEPICLSLANRITRLRLQEKELNDLLRRYETLWVICQAYIKDHHISCSESIWQVDEILLNTPDFLEQICEIVGYHECDNEDEL